MSNRFIFLGTGASAGVPLIGCACSVCVSGNPKNQRLRTAGLLILGDKRLLLDVGPDFRAQALLHHIHSIDGLILTHTHFDHIAGVDDLRIFCLRRKQPIPCLLSEESAEDLRRRYYYLFEPSEPGMTASVKLDMAILSQESGTVDFCGGKIEYFSYVQSKMKVTGYKIGSFAYVSDIREYDASIFSWLRGVETLVLSALQEAPSKLHLSFQEALLFAESAGAKKTWLVHMNHTVDHDAIHQKLPSHVQLAWDGLEITI